VTTAAKKGPKNCVSPHRHLDRLGDVHAARAAVRRRGLRFGYFRGLAGGVTRHGRKQCRFGIAREASGCFRQNARGPHTFAARRGIKKALRLWCNLLKVPTQKRATRRSRRSRTGWERRSRRSGARAGKGNWLRRRAHIGGPCRVERPGRNSCVPALLTMLQSAAWKSEGRAARLVGAGGSDALRRLPRDK